jgi:hypothetical protein
VQIVEYLDERGPVTSRGLSAVEDAGFVKRTADFGRHEVICGKREHAVDVARQRHRVQALRQFEVLLRHLAYSRSPAASSASERWRYV